MALLSWGWDGRCDSLPSMPELPDLVLYAEHLERRLRGATLLGSRVTSPNLLRTAVHVANLQILESAMAADELEGMATTLVAAVVHGCGVSALQCTCRKDRAEPYEDQT